MRINTAKSITLKKFNATEVTANFQKIDTTQLGKFEKINMTKMAANRCSPRGREI